MSGKRRRAVSNKVGVAQDWKGIFRSGCHDFDASIFSDSTSRVDEFAVTSLSQVFSEGIADRLGTSCCHARFELRTALSGKAILIMVFSLNIYSILLDNFKSRATSSAVWFWLTTICYEARDSLISPLPYEPFEQKNVSLHPVFKSLIRLVVPLRHKELPSVYNVFLKISCRSQV